MADLAALREHQITAESGGNPLAKNPLSSAYGIGQVISSTWMDWVRRKRPDLLQGRSTAQVLALRSDAGLSRQFMDDYNAENAQGLTQAGYEATPGNIDLAYFAGLGGAKSVLGANPNTPVTQILTPGAIAANPFLKNFTAADLIRWAGRRGGKGGSASPAPSSGARAVAQNAASNTTGGDSMAQNSGFLPQINTPDLGDAPSARKKQMAEALMKDALGNSGNIRSRGGVLARLAQLAAGHYMAGQYENQANERNRKLAQALAGAGDNDALFRTLLASGNEDLIKAAVNAKVRGAENASQRALTVTPMYDKDGKIVYGTTGGDGNWKPLGGTDGYSAAPKTTTRTEGTFSVTRDQYGNEIKREQMNLGEKERQEAEGAAVGKAQGAAKVDLPKVELSVKTALEYIDKVREDPNLANVTGWQAYGTGPSSVTGIPTLSSQNVDTEERIGQLEGRAFLNAYEAIKGAGQISEKEGEKAEKAQARLKNLKQSDSGYRAALDDFRNEVVALGELAKQKARSGRDSGVSVDQAGAINAAREAINQGADRAAVIQRLRERGFDPAGL